jgi:predicted peptidase
MPLPYKTQIKEERMQHNLQTTLFIILGVLSPIVTHAANDLSKLNPKPNSSLNLESTLTVSGLSSGGYMANQFHMAHAEKIKGAGILAAGPYFCSEDSLVTAEQQCLDKEGSKPPVADLLAIAQARAKQQRLADLTELQDDSIWIFHGTQDKLVTQSVTDALVNFYQELVPSKNIAYVNNLASGHGFPIINTSADTSASTDATRC